MHAFAGRDLDLYLTEDRGQPAAVHRGAGVLHTGDTISILDFHDHPPPAPIELPPAAMGDDTVQQFRSHLEIFLADNTFSTGAILEGLGEPDVH